MLAFYPADFSPGCTHQLARYQEALAEIEARNTALAGVSVDSMYCHRAFREHLGLSMPLLADFHPKGEMSRRYGAYIEGRGHCNRSLVVVDEHAVVRWSHAAETPKEIPSTELILDAISDA